MSVRKYRVRAATTTPYTKILGGKPVQVTLSHAPGGPDLSRAAQGTMPLLWHHERDNPDSVLGRVVAAWHDSQSTMMDVEFDDPDKVASPIRAQRIRQCIELLDAGHNGLSVGVARQTDYRPLGGNRFEVAHWLGGECSIAPVPAIGDTGVLELLSQQNAAPARIYVSLPVTLKLRQGDNLQLPESAPRGSFEAVVGHFDKVVYPGNWWGMGLVIESGAIGEGQDCYVGSWNHGDRWRDTPPTGTARVVPNGDEILAQGMFILSTAQGRETYETMLATAGQQEWSLVMAIMDYALRANPGEYEVMYASDVDIINFAPVDRGGDPDTRTSQILSGTGVDTYMPAQVVSNSTRAVNSTAGDDTMPTITQEDRAAITADILAALRAEQQAQAQAPAPDTPSEPDAATANAGAAPPPVDAPPAPPAPPPPPSIDPALSQQASIREEADRAVSLGMDEKAVQRARNDSIGEGEDLEAFRARLKSLNVHPDPIAANRSKEQPYDIVQAVRRALGFATGSEGEYELALSNDLKARIPEMKNKPGLLIPYDALLAVSAGALGKWRPGDDLAITTSTFADFRETLVPEVVDMILPDPLDLLPFVTMMTSDNSPDIKVGKLRVDFPEYQTEAQQASGYTLDSGVHTDDEPLSPHIGLTRTINTSLTGVRDDEHLAQVVTMIAINARRDQTIQILRGSGNAPTGIYGLTGVVNAGTPAGADTAARVATLAASAAADDNMIKLLGPSRYAGGLGRRIVMSGELFEALEKLASPPGVARLVEGDTIKGVPVSRTQYLGGFDGQAFSTYDKHARAIAGPWQDTRLKVWGGMMVTPVQGSGNSTTNFELFWDFIVLHPENWAQFTEA